MSETDLLEFTRNDLATSKDKQYVDAETALLTLIKKNHFNTTYEFNKSNLNYALK